MADSACIDVPNVLNSQPEAVEALIHLIQDIAPHSRITLCCTAISWFCPYGVVSLFGVCRYLAQLAGQPVRITGLRDDIYAYLRRIDFFEQTDFITAADPFDTRKDLARSEASPNVLELVEIRTQRDIFHMGGRARRILGYWLGQPYGQRDIDQIVSLLAEACSNVVDHSHDFGIVTIQKYNRSGSIDVELAISDLGQGIPHSLMEIHGPVSDSCSGFIERALAGLSARPGGRGGQGLGAIQRIATTSGGTLYIRSETGSVLVAAEGIKLRDGLAFFPGTQMAVTFRSYL